MTRPLRAAIYARFSTDLQRDASIEDQLRSCRDHAQRQGWQAVETYSDRAISGASLMRSGIQALMRDASGGCFDVLIAHALDRLSRNQADIAGLYEQLQFARMRIETVTEGSIDEMHIGLKGTMNALFLKDLGKKTREGLKGRALAGKSAGGRCYGYDVVTRFDSRGEAIRGDRSVNRTEAATVRRIFRDYAAGISPKKIAERLNLEGIAGPQGGSWGASTIHGNRERGNGILNNELYIGRQVWNRLHYVKDRAIGKRVLRLNPEADWVITGIPELRIIDDALWEAVRVPQGPLRSKGTDTPVWDRRRPKFLFSRLMACDCCGGGFSKIGKESFGCSNARNKGAAVCGNRLTIRRQDLETTVLDALANNLMDPEAVRVFCEEYAAERNRLQAAAAAGRAVLEKELAQVTRDHRRLVDAIIAGVPAEQVKDRLVELDTRRQEIERRLADAPAPDPVRLHPAMAQTYRERIGELIRGLADAERMEEAKEALRALVERIVLTPAEDGSHLTIDLEGALAALLRMATGRHAETASSGKNEAVDVIGELVLVAGTGFEPVTFRL